jgi:hypothetical protein
MNDYPSRIRRPIMEYKVIEARDKVLKLEEKVNRHIQDGWVPVGGVTVVYSPGTNYWWFYQAMTKVPDAPADRPRE